MKRILLLALPIALMTACSNPPASTKSETAATPDTSTAAPAANLDTTQLAANHQSASA